MNNFPISIDEGRVILINKPIGWTSFDVVNKLRYTLKTKKIGHAGTLDPLASGLLIVCTDKLTKKIDTFQAQEKEYTGIFVIGQTTPSHDLETAISEPVDISHISEETIRQVAQTFIGTIQQIPPLHSAIKINGRRAYHLARRGNEFKLNPREITISTFDITSVEQNTIHFKIVCSKGTYIRSIARDLGNKLGVGAYLASLCRTRIGNFKLENSQSIDQIEQGQR